MSQTDLFGMSMEVVGLGRMETWKRLMDIDRNKFDRNNLFELCVIL